MEATLHLSLHGQEIEQVKMYLGITIDEDLTFNIHVDNVINKINRSLGVLKRTRPFVPLSNCIHDISLIAIPYDHREKTIPSLLCVCNSVIRLFPETNVGDKMFRSKHEIILEKYFNVFEKSNTL